MKWLTGIPVSDSAGPNSVANTANNVLGYTPRSGTYTTYEAILARSPAFRWLCASIVKDLILQPDSSVANHFSSTIQRVIPHRQKRVSFKFHWDLAGFLKQEYGDINQALGEVTTITGTPDHAQAVTCSTYLNQVWPCVGSEILCAIQEAFRELDGNQGTPKTRGEFPLLVSRICVYSALFWAKHADDDHSEVQLSDGKTSVTADFQLYTSTFQFHVNGTKETISEAGEVAAWIVGALRSSGIETGINILPEIRYSFYDLPCDSLYDSPDALLQIHIRHNFLDNLSNEQDPTSTSLNMSSGACWHAMFRNPVVVSGFPVLRRPNNLEHTGMEISLDMMASLVRAPRLTEYAGRHYLKGFSSMLVAVRKNDGIVLWHHFFNPSGERISYLDAKVTESSDCYDVSTEDILSLRHIIGWCDNAQFRAGTLISF